MKKTTFLLLAMLLSLSLYSQTDTDHQGRTAAQSDPRAVQFHTEDVVKFWEVFDKTAPTFRGKTWQKEYLNNGSAGLKAFTPRRIGNGKQLSKTLRENQTYYEAVRKSTLAVPELYNRFYECFDKLKELYPAATFPDVYFVIGRKNTGGTIFSQGVLIGIERFGPREVKGAITTDHLDETVTHELIHIQQHYAQDPSLLAKCLREGSADFLTLLITGTKTNAKMHRYGEEHQEALWKEFTADMKGSNMGNWFYSPKNTSRPNDMGYWMGFKITEAYYTRMENKQQAVHDILNITHFETFLQKSGYAGK